MLSTKILYNTIYNSLRAESQVLNEGTGLIDLPEKAVAQLIGRGIFSSRNEIFGQAGADWARKQPNTEESPWQLNFVYILPDGKKERIVVSVSTGSHIMMIPDHKALFTPVLTLSDESRRYFSCCLLRAPETQQKDLTQKYADSDLAKAIPLGIAKLGNDVLGGQQLWLMMWEVKPPAEQSAAVPDIQRALNDAVKNMRIENMLSVLTKIISLRTAIEEELIRPEMTLTTVFQMAFAKEQGVSLEEVYDPQAMAGFTDTQLAAHNLLEDLQKTFCINIAEEEQRTIKTLKQLADVITGKIHA